MATKAEKEKAAKAAERKLAKAAAAAAEVVAAEAKAAAKAAAKLAKAAATAAPAAAPETPARNFRPVGTPAATAPVAAPVAAAPVAAAPVAARPKAPHEEMIDKYMGDATTKLITTDTMNQLRFNMNYFHPLETRVGRYKLSRGSMMDAFTISIIE